MTKVPNVANPSFTLHFQNSLHLHSGHFHTHPCLEGIVPDTALSTANYNGYFISALTTLNAGNPESLKISLSCEQPELLCAVLQ